ncbi:ABC transporter ATP-binding protein [Erysipelothrix urinaevulpis]|uniref:ABC transporter ATP-binding protein n=1 Tax=Erysipelothrix urinaevulpis TaxID=2683717 RepID=UPI00135B32A0|nr:ABC transporter ATP-binding protein [Erysipelothrix urinaevulpis]
MNTELLKLNKITKVYDNGIVANKDIDLTIYEHEIHAIVGENGAGKSTLMKIIFGMEQPTMGEYFLRGEKVSINSVDQAINHGIGMVHQHFMLVESMDVVDNIMLGIEPKKSLFMNKKEARQRVEAIADKYMFKLDYDKPVSEISIGMKQKVEIIKALIRGAKLLILDEPTAVLTPQETEELFVQLKMLTKSGHTIVFISHKLNEVKAISDRVSVIRKGKTQGSFPAQDLSLEEITRLMVGRNVSLNYEKNNVLTGETLLSVSDLNLIDNRGHVLKNLNFSVREGEIIGVCGVEGNGQSDLIQILTSRNKSYSGHVNVFDGEMKEASIQSLREKGFGYIPEDRMHEGIAKDEMISENAISTRYKESRFGRDWRIDKKEIELFSDQLIEEFQVACHGNDHIVGYLSGGNIQKVVVGREAGDDITLLIAEQPTRGVDLGAAEIIHRRLLAMRDQGVAILLVSADLNEVVELSDRCLVFYDGEIVANLENPKSYSEQELGEFMLGLKRQEGSQS